jgi:uncharacterized protein YjiS (DUF1127 family)
MSVHHPTEWLRSQDRSTTLAEHVHPKARLLTRLVRAVAAYGGRRRERRTLYQMSEAELRDIGITRADIDRVFGPEFAGELACEFALPGAALHELR